MAGHRIERIQEDIKRLLPGIIREMKDPRVNNGLLSIVRVDLTNDLSYATVYVSSLEGKQAAADAVVGLQHGAGFIRNDLNKALKIRKSPELRFIADDSMEYGAEMEKRVRRLTQKEDSSTEE